MLRREVENRLVGMAPNYSPTYYKKVEIRTNMCFRSHQRVVLNTFFMFCREKT
jgi:hypothetical protein